MGGIFSLNSSLRSTYSKKKYIYISTLLRYSLTTTIFGTIILAPQTGILWLLKSLSGHQKTVQLAQLMSSHGGCRLIEEFLITVTRNLKIKVRALFRQELNFRDIFINVKTGSNLKDTIQIWLMTIIDKAVLKRSSSAIKLEWVASSIKQVTFVYSPVFRWTDKNKGNVFLPTLTAFRVLVYIATLQHCNKNKRF